MRRLAPVLLALVMGVAMGRQALAACLKANTDGQVAEGKVLSGRFTDFAGRTEQAFILELAAPACLDGEDYDKVESTSRVHIYSMDAGMRRRIRELVGKKVRVRGNPFGEHTAHHHAPIVMPISDIEPIR